MRASSARAIAPRASITTWPTPEQKGRFAALAQSRGLSESKLLGLLIDAVLAENPVRRAAALKQKARDEDPATDRLTIRLRPGDGAALERRAEGRGMPPSSYVAALVRAHVSQGAVLSPRELAAIERSLAQVSASNRALLRLSNELREQGSVDRHLREELRQVQRAVSGALEASRALVKSAVESWELPDV